MEFKVQQGFSDHDSAGAAFNGAVTERLFNMKNDCYSVHFDRVTVDSVLHVITLIREMLPVKSRVQAYRPREATILLENEETFFTVRSYESNLCDPCEVRPQNIYVCGYGALSLVSKVVKLLEENIKKNPVPSITWVHAQKGERVRRSITPAKAKPVRDSFYPWIGDVNAYYDRYMTSESVVLVLLGLPGTAKTSFIRNLIWRDGLSTMFTYDTELLESDGLFADFITGNDNLLVVEDADTMLTDRDHGGNKIMSKFLNISDGLAASEKRKKIIFTANIVEPSRIDSALLRPGRCFDCQVFRKLTAEEAIVAASAADLEFSPEGRHYSLAEMFAQSKGEIVSTQPVRTGFMR